MKTPSVASKTLSSAARRRVELAIAVAQERLLATNVQHALELIELVGDQVPFDDALEIYHRLLRLSEDVARIVTTRALARLGEHTGEGRSWPERMAEADAAAAGGEGRGRGSFFTSIRQRLRGRIQEDLRRWIELEAARTEVALFETHVNNALNFVEILESELSFHEATELYLEALDVRDSVAEVVYYFTLARLNPKILPSRTVAEAPPVTEGALAAAASGGAERHLRVVDRQGD